MGALVHSATYQGYAGTAGALRWDTGLEPSSGYIDLNLEDVKKILIDVKPVPWGGNTFGGLISIKASQKATGTVVQQPGDDLHRGPGLSNFGDLVLKTFDGQGTWHTPVTYRNIFVAEAGVEEIQRNLARVRLHSEGKIRVQLTDVRMFYRKHGALLQRFNVRRPGGEFDQITLKASGGGDGGAAAAAQGGDTSGASFYGNSDQTVVSPVGGGGGAEQTFTPWTAKELMEHLLKMLPGGPRMDANSDFAKDTLEVPVDIIGEGEPIVDWIAKLLAQYGYVAQLQPDSATYLIMKLGKKAEYGKIATGINQWETITDEHYERKTSWIKNRPPAVSVIGKRRVRRISIPYLPVFQSSEDGMIYKLSALPKIYDGYSLDKLNKQVMVGHEKNFRNVPPVDTVQGIKRGLSLRKCAYRMYAPASAFKKGEVRITLQDLQRQWFMPIKKCPVYLNELEKWFWMNDPPEDQQQGDNGPFALVAPIVRAYRYGQGFFKDYAAIQKHFQSVSEWVEKEINWVNTLNIWIETRLQNPGLLKPQDKLEETKDGTKYNSKVGPTVIDKTADGLAIIGSRISRGLTKLQAAQTMRDEEIDLVTPPTKEEQVAAKQMLADAQAYKLSVVNDMTKYAVAFGAGGGVMMKCQLPWGLVERGHYTINTQTGIVMFSEPAVRCKQPFLLDHDQGEIRADGAVSVTFGYELNNNTPMDYTTVSFVADEQNPDDAPKAKVVSLCYPLEMPSHCEHASSMQLYEDQQGIPFNQTAVITEAASYATGVLEVPHRADGYTYELDGLRKAVLEGGVSSVQHEWSEDGTAYTHVMVNAPYARGIIPGRMKDAWTASVEDRRRIETSKGNEDQ